MLPVDFDKDFRGHAGVPRSGTRVCLFIYSFFYTFFNSVSLGVSVGVSLAVSLGVVSAVVAYGKVFRFLFRKAFRLVFHPGNHAVFLEQSQEPEGRRRAPVPQLGQAPDAHPELPSVESGVRIINASCQNVRQMEPRFEARELFPTLEEEGIRPGFSPKECVSSVHPVTISNGDSTTNSSPAEPLGCEFWYPFGTHF